MTDATSLPITVTVLKTSDEAVLLSMEQHYPNGEGRIMTVKLGEGEKLQLFLEEEAV